MTRRDLVPLGRCCACHSMHVGGGQGFAADSPIATFHFLDHAPSDATHALALDHDHRISQFADDLALLFFAEHVLDDANLNERHWSSPVVTGGGAYWCFGDCSSLDTNTILPNTGRNSNRQFQRQLA